MHRDADSQGGHLTASRVSQAFLVLSLVLNKALFRFPTVAEISCSLCLSPEQPNSATVAFASLVLISTSWVFSFYLFCKRPCVSIPQG